MKESHMAGCATGGVRWILRGEGVVLLLAALALYTEVGSSWVLFAILFLAPDLSFLGYVAGPRVGAPVYNAAHSTVGPLLLGLAGAAAGSGLAVSIALIWLAHIGADRLLGYGLKYQSAFQDTHLGRIGRAAAVSR
jgi:hypothetical protein